MLDLYTDPLYGFWYFLAASSTLIVESVFALFIGVLAIFLIWKSRGLRALSGLRWAGAAGLLWAFTQVIAKVTFYFTGLLDLRWRMADLLGSGITTMGVIGIDTVGLLIDGVCVLMLVVGLVSVARRLAEGAQAAPAAAAPDVDPAELTDPGPLAVVANR